MDDFANPEKKPFGNILGKGENDGNQYFLLFEKCFLTLSRVKLIIYITFNQSSAKCFQFEWALLCGKVLTSYQMAFNPFQSDKL